MAIPNLYIHVPGHDLPISTFCIFNLYLLCRLPNENIFTSISSMNIFIYSTLTGLSFQDLHQLEDQLTRSEDELFSKRREFEEQRQKELDIIEVEKFKLQEMEHEERINALVEQEVP